MSALTICLELDCDFEGCLDKSTFERNYQDVYKKLISFLYAHPKFEFSFYFAGEQLEFLKQKHPEALAILSELTCRHQVEVLGGGYYNPICSLLFPVDRSGQIEKMTSELRKTIGKRPRGFSLFESIWDSSLITTLQSCGMEYVLLESSLIPENKKKYFPLIASEQGKSIKVIPTFEDLKPHKNENTDDWISRINKGFSKQERESLDEKLITVSFKLNEVNDILNSDFLENINTLCISADSIIRFSTPQNYLKNAKIFIPSYIPAGMSLPITKWSQKPYEISENKTRFQITIADFLNTYSQSHRLYERMMYISMIVSQSHGDKTRKISAREELWEAQSGMSYIFSPENISNAARLRQYAYNKLNEAERIISECGKSNESVTSFDYNGDGLNEYICQMKRYNAVISLHSGSITELSLIQGGGNYADSLTRMSKFDNVDDNYERRLFVEHLFENDDKEKYIKHIPCSNGIFSNVQFTEKKFENQRKEIQLEGRGEFSSLQQPVCLKKNYLVTANGFSIQYILKNESPLSLKGFFIVESNLAQTDFENQRVEQYNAEIILNGKRQQIDKNDNFKTDSGVSVLMVTDIVNNISFMYEPNEESGFTCSTLVFKRPDNEGKLVDASRTFTSALIWNVDLAAGMEMEKTINISIVSSKKSKSSKPKK